MLGVAFEWASARWRRASTAFLAVLVLGGAVSLHLRNELYRRAGGVTSSNAS